MNDRERILQALENVGNTYGGSTKVLLHAIVREEKRLKKWEESQRNKEQNQRFNDAHKEFKATGEWPTWFNRDDDIPF